MLNEYENTQDSIDKFKIYSFLLWSLGRTISALLRDAKLSLGMKNNIFNFERTWKIVIEYKNYQNKHWQPRISGLPFLIFLFVHLFLPYLKARITLKLKDHALMEKTFIWRGILLSLFCWQPNLFRSYNSSLSMNIELLLNINFFERVDV